MTRYSGLQAKVVQHLRLAGPVSLLVFLCVLVPAAAYADEVCPNEAVRLEQGVAGRLSDCRAYEMVSPAYQEGFPLFLASYTAEGDQAIVNGIGDLASAPGAGEEALEPAYYSESRGVGGWRAASLNASLGRFVGQVPIASEASGGLSLWIQHAPGQSAKTRDLYIRSATGAYSFVGPLDPHGTSGEEVSDVMEVQANEEDVPKAATSDYGHIVLRAHETPDFWSFDKTLGESSLYEYSGTNNKQPILVAVNGPVKGNTDLIAECGAVLGGGERGSMYNGLSADGETVFFTVEPCGTAPATAEVYARLHGSQVSPLPGETFDVSESECTSACGGVSGKNFEGASEDGKRVYFTSTQKLTNDAVDGTASGNAVEDEEKGCAAAVTAGGGGGGCNLYEYEFLPEHRHVLRLVAGGDEVLGVAGMAEDGDRLYFVAREEIASAGENEYHARPVREQPNLYVYDADTQKTKFITTLSGGDETDWLRFFQDRSAEVSGDDGQFLLFVSAKENPGITPDATGNLHQLFEYDADTEELVRVSKGENGYNNNGNNAAHGVSSEFIAGFANGAQGFREANTSLNVSEDGGTVVFTTAGELSPLAVSAQKGCTSIYAFSTTGPLSQGDVHLISDGRDVQPNKGSQCGAIFAGMDASGNNILFSTADPLVSGDVDGVIRSLYDARVDGGFGPSLGEGSCGGGGCEAPASTTPSSVSAAPGSAGLTGTGNLAPPVVANVAPRATTKKVVKCARGEKLSHSHCVKTKPKKAAKRNKGKGKR